VCRAGNGVFVYPQAGGEESGDEIITYIASGSGDYNAAASCLTFGLA
jgi:hypothetical protein